MADSSSPSRRFSRKYARGPRPVWEFPLLAPQQEDLHVSKGDIEAAVLPGSESSTKPVCESSEAFDATSLLLNVVADQTPGTCDPSPPILSTVHEKFLDMGNALPTSDQIDDANLGNERIIQSLPVSGDSEESESSEELVSEGYVATAVPSSPIHVATTSLVSPSHVATSAPASPIHVATCPPAHVTISPPVHVTTSANNSSTPEAAAPETDLPAYSSPKAADPSLDFGSSRKSKRTVSRISNSKENQVCLYEVLSTFCETFL